MRARLIGGIAAAALLSAGLACPGAAVAADPAGYPHELGFTPSRLIATDDAVYAVGIDDSDTAYLAEVGAGAPVEISSDTYSIDAALTPDGSALRLVTSDDDGYHYWDVDAHDLGVVDAGTPDPGVTPEALGTDAGSLFEVRDIDGEGLVLAAAGQHSLAESDASDSASIGAVGARGAVGHRTWYAAGTEYGDETQTATLWSYDEDAGAAPAPVTLGTPGSPDESVESLAVDQSSGGPVYALSWRNNDDGPQTFGLSVVDDGSETYVPLSYPARRIALSPDGETLYVAESDSVLALDVDDLSDYADEDARGISADSTVTALAVDGVGNVFAGTRDGSVRGFGRPAAPTDLVATPDSMSTTGFSASWDEGRYSWELEGDEDLTQYAYTVRAAGGGVVASDTTFDQLLFVDDLQAGTTYTVEVTASNGLQTSEPAVDEVTTHSRYVAAPSAVTVQGSLTVGSQLSLASTGSWEEGTALSYEWYGSTGEMGGAIGSGPTLTLTADHLGMTITGVVTGTKAGAAGVTLDARASGTVSNPPVTTPPGTTPPATTPPATAAPGKLTAPKPKITGTAKVGRTLAAKAGSWTKGTRLTYHWSANGKRIKGADHAKLKLTKALRGKKISVEVTGTKAGYTTVTKESQQTGKVRR